MFLVVNGFILFLLKFEFFDVLVVVICGFLFIIFYGCVLWIVFWLMFIQVVMFLMIVIFWLLGVLFLWSGMFRSRFLFLFMILMSVWMMVFVDL